MGALGCGAFRNPPDYISAIFEAAIRQFSGYFKRIIFCILEENDSNSYKKNEAFIRTFQISRTTFGPVTSLAGCESVGIPSWNNTAVLTAPGDASLLEKLAGGIDMVCKDAGTCYETDPAHY